MTDTTLKKRIGKNLQRGRKSGGYKSANAFADAFGISRSAYVEYEQGRVALPIDRAWEFADYLGLTIDELVGRNFPRQAYKDPRQEKLNGCFESLNEESKTQVADMVKSIAADPARRIEKDGADLSDLPDVAKLA